MTVAGSTPRPPSRCVALACPRCGFTGAHLGSPVHPAIVCPKCGEATLLVKMARTEEPA